MELPLPQRLHQVGLTQQTRRDAADEDWKFPVGASTPHIARRHSVLLDLFFLCPRSLIFLGFPYLGQSPVQLGSVSAIQGLAGCGGARGRHHSLAISDLSLTGVPGVPLFDGESIFGTGDTTLADGLTARVVSDGEHTAYRNRFQHGR